QNDRVQKSEKTIVCTSASQLRCCRFQSLSVGQAVSSRRLTHRFRTKQKLQITIFLGFFAVPFCILS
ncbi:unnamed protein product, partial [Amoebophrya sp. A120]